MRLFLISLQIAACTIAAPKAIDNPTPVAKATYSVPQEHKTAYFASGCFWCVEAVFEHVDGVQEAISGYAGGTTINPNYRQVVSGKTGHAESIKIVYDPKKVSFKTLVQVFFGSHFPRFIINLTNDDLEWWETFSKEDKEQATTEMAHWIERATAFYDNEINTYTD